MRHALALTVDSIDYQLNTTSWLITSDLPGTVIDAASLAIDVATMLLWTEIDGIWQIVPLTSLGASTLPDGRSAFAVQAAVALPVGAAWELAIPSQLRSIWSPGGGRIGGSFVGTDQPSLAPGGYVRLRQTDGPPIAGTSLMWITLAVQSSPNVVDCYFAGGAFGAVAPTGPFAWTVGSGGAVMLVTMTSAVSFQLETVDPVNVGEAVVIPPGAPLTLGLNGARVCPAVMVIT
jgi:hypothetical protein